jgi:acyl-CoA thioesterase FadM
MNLWLRFFWLLLTAFRRSPIPVPHGKSVLAFRVLPLDLDVSLHMNNGRYLTIMDLGRVDVILRSGLWRAVWRHGWTPVANAVVIRFRRELRAFERYRLETQIVAWDERAVVMEQIFVFQGGTRDGQVAARALMKGGLYDRRERKYVPVSRLMSEIGASAESPVPSGEIKAFLEADDAMKQSDAVPER